MASVITTKHSLIQVNESKGFALLASASNVILRLAANTAQNILISDLADVDGNLPTFLNFNAVGGDFYIVWQGTNAAIPSSNQLAGTSGEFNPALRRVGSYTQFSIVSASAMSVGIGLFVGQ